MRDKYGVLKEYFGHDSFREGQDRITNSLLGGRDVLGIMPTGAGKSICYQVPALMFEGVTVVVSPLISLMKDQVSALVQSGVAAAYINSSLTHAQYLKVLQNTENGKYKIIYVAPERLCAPAFSKYAAASAYPWSLWTRRTASRNGVRIFARAILKFRILSSLSPRAPLSARSPQQPQALSGRI